MPAAGTVPNRLDDHMGEIANVHQLHPEIVVGYIVLFDNVADSRRQDGTMWSDFFRKGSEHRVGITKLAFRRLEHLEKSSRR